MADKLNQQSWPGISNGNADIWQEFLNWQIPHLYRMFMNHWPNPSLAEELLQKTVFDAVRARTTYQPSKGSPQEWIFGIARNNIRLEIRKRANRPSVDGDISSYVDTIDTKPLPDEVLERKETSAIVEAALNRLPAKEQAVLMAKYIEGLSAHEIARQMNSTEKAVHDLLYRARISLRQELKRIAPGG
jgi:RNA polymerase sigma-70 factor (ECF subfamily)